MLLVSAPSINLLERLSDHRHFLKKKNTPYTRHIIDKLNEEFKFFGYLQIIIETLPKDSQIKCLFSNVQKTDKIAPDIIAMIKLDDAVIPHITRPLHDQLEMIKQKISKMKLNERDKAFSDKFDHVLKALNKNQPFDKKVFIIFREARGDLLTKSTKIFNDANDEIQI